MPTHWTYEEFETDSDLAQGDILKRTVELDNITNNVHSHFSNEKYLGFLVTVAVSPASRPLKAVPVGMHVDDIISHGFGTVLVPLLVEGEFNYYLTEGDDYKEYREGGRDDDYDRIMNIQSRDIKCDSSDVGSSFYVFDERMPHGFISRREMMNFALTFGIDWSGE